MTERKKFLITSALPYANGPLHFGHLAGAYLPADVFARAMRLLGHDVLYLCGSDEYGLPITINAEAAGRTPREHVEIYHEINLAFFTKCAISFDHFGRTTWEGHQKVVQQFFLDLLENGHIKEKVTDQLYSEKEGKFLADRYVEGTCPRCGFDKARGDECQKCGASYEATDLKAPRSKLTGSPLVKRGTRHWFLQFDQFKEALRSWIEQKEWKSNVKNFALSFVTDLRERSITRDSTWGVPIPLEGTEGKVFYVWFDAPIGYISIAKEWAEKIGDKERWKEYWMRPDVKLVNFVGKDNIPFHALFFPAMIMGQNAPYKLVDDLPANEFLNLEGRQFSKSDKWTIDLNTFFLHYSTDQMRYYLAAIAPETSDSEFTWKEFQHRCNGELLAKFGNFANRTLVFAQKHCGGLIPSHSSGEEEKALFNEMVTLTKEIQVAYEGYHVRKASQLLMEMATKGNVYFDRKKPWLLVKDPTKKEEMDTVIVSCLYCLRTLALAASPIIPSSAQRIWEMLGQEGSCEKQHWQEAFLRPLEVGTPLPEPTPLFGKIEDEQVEKEMEQLQQSLPKETKPYTPLKEAIGIEDFAKVDLRIGKIEAVERVEKSKKLLKLTVDLGFEKRTIVSGISHYFSDLSVLIGKNAIFVANLKPVKLMGIESQGMLIVSHSGETVELPLFNIAEPGDQID